MEIHQPWRFRPIGCLRWLQTRSFLSVRDWYGLKGSSQHGCAHTHAPTGGWRAHEVANIGKGAREALGSDGNGIPSNQAPSLRLSYGLYVSAPFFLSFLCYLSFLSPFRLDTITNVYLLSHIRGQSVTQKMRTNMCFTMEDVILFCQFQAIIV